MFPGLTVSVSNISRPLPHKERNRLYFRPQVFGVITKTRGHHGVINPPIANSIRLSVLFFFFLEIMYMSTNSADKRHFLCHMRMYSHVKKDVNIFQFYGFTNQDIKKNNKSGPHSYEIRQSQLQMNDNNLK